jgi:hypothetical protein
LLPILLLFDFPPLFELVKFDLTFPDCVIQRLNHDNHDVDCNVRNSDTNQAIANQTPAVQIWHELGKLVQVVGGEEHKRLVHQVHSVRNCTWHRRNQTWSCHRDQGLKVELENAEDCVTLLKNYYVSEPKFSEKADTWMNQNKLILSFEIEISYRIAEPCKEVDIVAKDPSVVSWQAVKYSNKKRKNQDNQAKEEG